VIPLYRGAADAPKEGHAGLYYDKFFDTWGEDWSLKNVGDRKPKQAWIAKITEDKVGDTALLNEYRSRIRQLVTARGGEVWVYKTEERLVTGTGLSHPVANGFVWHPTLGVPYLPGSSIKGLIGQGNRETVLGSEARVGRVICLPAVPTCPVRLAADVITPHYSQWTEKEPPGDWRSPGPILFLTVAPGAEFLFAVFPRTKNDREAVIMTGQWLDDALTNMGAGAKTAVGYGRMRFVPEDKVPWLKAQKQEAERARQNRLEQQRLAQMDPLEREFVEIARQSTDPKIKRWVLLLKELVRGRWPDPNQAKAVAWRVRADMEADGNWRPQTRSKNPAKDHAHQDTLLILKYLD
jgi:CRISPR-associated protein Cmr6